MLSRKLSYADTVKLLHSDLFNIQPIMQSLNPKNILCLSDTTDTFPKKGRRSDSIAVNIAQQTEMKEKNTLSLLKITQSDYGDSRGAHLPQNKNQPRREYLSIDNSQFKATQEYDLILGRALLCCCNDCPISCGGINGTRVAQEKFIKSLMEANANLIVLSSNAISDKKNDYFYKKGRDSLKIACENLSAFYGDYDFIFVDQYLKINGFVNVKNSGHLLLIAKRNSVSITNLPATALVYRQQSTLNKLHIVTSRMLHFFKNEMPRNVLIRDDNNNEIIRLKIAPSMQEELYQLRNAVGTNTIRKQINDAVYVINSSYLTQLKDNNLDGFNHLSQILGIPSKELQTLLEKNNSKNDARFAEKASWITI